MVRIIQYDPKISAAAYSQRRAAEEGFDSGLATGLAKLGRAVSERERRTRRAGAGAMAAREALGFWDSEVARLDELGTKIPPGKPGFHDLAMKEHLARRTETIARLKETDPEQAALFDLRTRPLVEMLERRASAMEAEAGGQTLSAGMGGALVAAAKTVRADPLQHDAIRDGLAETLSEMERNGVDADALARVRVSADRSLATAAIGGLIDGGQFGDARELLTEGRMPALTPEDRREQERLVGRAERRAEAAGSAQLAAAEDAYWAGYRLLEASLREGGEAPDLRYTDESIRAALPREPAETMIALREAAEDAGDAYARVALASRDTIDTLIAGAGPDEARHLRAAARDRSQRLAEDPAAFVLGNPRVRAAHDAWRTAEESDDPVAIAGATQAYALASLDEQRRLGVAEADRRVLPAESAAEIVTAFTAGERPDPAALGAELRARFGDLWRPVLEDLKAAGLPEGMAAIAGLGRPEQQAAAQRLAALVGTPTGELRRRIDDEDAEALDRALKTILPELGQSGAAGLEVGAQSGLVERRGLDLIAAGEAPESAAVMAAAEVLAKSPEEAAAFKRAAPNRLAAAPKPPTDQQSTTIVDAALQPEAELENSLAMVEEITELAKRLGLDWDHLPPESARLRDVLNGLNTFSSLSAQERDALQEQITAFRGDGHRVWVQLRDKFVELQNSSGPALVVEEPLPTFLAPDYWERARPDAGAPSAPTNSIETAAGGFNDDAIARFRKFEEQTSLLARPLPDGRIGFFRLGEAEPLLPVSPAFALELVNDRSQLMAVHLNEVPLPEQRDFAGMLESALTEIAGLSGDERARSILQHGQGVASLMTDFSIPADQLSWLVGELSAPDEPRRRAAAELIANVLTDRPTPRQEIEGLSMLWLRGNLDMDAYAAVWRDDYYQHGAIDLGVSKQSDKLAIESTERVMRGLGLEVLPPEVVSEIQLLISRVLHIPEDERRATRGPEEEEPLPRAVDQEKLAALSRYVDGVITPLSARLGGQMQEAIRAFNVSEVDFCRIPGRFGSMMTTENLGALRNCDKEDLHKLDEDLNLPEALSSRLGFQLGGAGAAADISMLAAERTTLGWVGLTISGAGVVSSILDHNEEWNRYLIERELQFRLLDPDTAGEVEAWFRQRKSGAHLADPVRPPSGSPFSERP